MRILRILTGCLLLVVLGGSCDEECPECEECEECEVCDECPVDEDGDGFSEEQGDCDDGDADIHPLADEVCGDAVDQDCSGDPDDGVLDVDGDGYLAVACTDGDDCDDDDAERHPEADDGCDGIDNDCDGSTDEDVIVVDPSGGGDATSIQDAVDDGMYGDVICVHPGTYGEDVTFEGKNVTVMALSGPEDTVIEGTGGGSAVSHTFGDSSTLIGLTIRGGAGTPFDPDYDGIEDLCGGGLFIDASDVTLTGLVITGNTSADGAGIYVNNAKLQMQDSVITANIGTRYGGGIRLRESYDVVIDGSEITDNSARAGGGLATYAAGATFLDSVIEGNEAETKGGGMYSGTDSQLTFSSCSIADNTALEMGGGVRLYNAQAYFGGSDITGNSAGEDGGGIACKSSSMSLSGGAVSDNDPDDISCDECDGCTDSP
ncbi:MAG: right-handed parallel beta-helix repeat-containing protein [Myxococcota bacterium]|nr:right-handed parallel beta-helix repeat-containing protein [Myxococcota bacterium]